MIVTLAQVQHAGLVRVIDHAVLGYNTRHELRMARRRCSAEAQRRSADGDCAWTEDREDTEHAQQQDQMQRVGTPVV